MFFLDHIWLIPLLPAFGAAMMFFFGRKLQKITVSAVCGLRSRQPWQTLPNYCLYLARY
jgi:hypothetical protein